MLLANFCVKSVLPSALVGRCIKLIQNRVPAQVKGRDIGESLISVLKQIVKDEGYGFAYTRLQEHLEAYEDKHVRALTKRGADEMQIEALQDKVKTILICYLYWGATNVEALYEKIRSMFGEEEKSGTALNPKVVNFCTVHRAKGLEAERVFIIDPKSLPLTWKDQQRWQFEQEMNLKYVALTRSKSDLFIVGDNPQAPSIPVKGQMEPPAQWYDQVKPKPERQSKTETPNSRWTIPDWEALADIDTDWCAAPYTPRLVVQLPDAPALKEKIQKLDETLEALDHKARRARWTRESEVQSERFHKFCREFRRGSKHVNAQ